MTCIMLAACMKAKGCAGLRKIKGRKRNDPGHNNNKKGCRVEIPNPFSVHMSR